MDFDERVFALFGGREKYEESIENLISFAQIKPGEKVLELCCGTGISTRYLLQKTRRVTAVELNPERMQHAKQHLLRGVKLLMINAYELSPKGHGQYEKVLCLNGFHHFEPEDGFYRIAERMLIPGGELIYNVKLHDDKGIRPVHTFLPSVVGEILYEMRLFSNKPAAIIDRAFIDSTRTLADFSAIPLFRIEESRVNNIYHTWKSWFNYKEYLRFLAAEFTKCDDLLYGLNSVAGSLADWRYRTFDEKLFEYIDKNLPEQKRLIKPELFIRASKREEVYPWI